MTPRIPVQRPSLGKEEVEAVALVMESGMIAQGQVVAEFEGAFASYCGVRHAVATSNGTTALHASLLAAGIRPADEVIVPSFTFIATATSVSMCGARPVFADVEDRTFTLDPASVESLITPKTRAVMGVHLFGQPFDIPALTGICRDHDLLLIEDAAQAHGFHLQRPESGILWEACMLLLLRDEEHDHRRGGHGHHRQCRARRRGSGSSSTTGRRRRYPPHQPRV